MKTYPAEVKAQARRVAETDGITAAARAVGVPRSIVESWAQRGSWTAKNLRARTAKAPAGPLPADPHRLAAAYLARSGWTKSCRGQELDDVWSDALTAVAEAFATWSATRGMSFAAWAWQAMQRDVPRGWRRRQTHRSECVLDTPDLPAGDQLRRRCVEAGYGRVEDADELRRIAAWAALTGAEAAAARWFAAHGGMLDRAGVAQRQGPWGGARRKLRAAAAARSEWHAHRAGRGPGADI